MTTRKPPAHSPQRDEVVSAVFSKLEKIVRGRPRQLEDEIKKMREWLTRDRASRPSGYMNQPKAISAYTAYHLPLHLPELFWILDRNVQRLGLPLPRSILDVGCGPGTTTLSYLLWAYMRDKDLSALESIQLFDQSSRALDTADELVKALIGALPTQKTSPVRPDIHRVRGNLNYPVDRKRFGRDAQWIFLSHVLNEYGNGPRHRQKKFDFLCRLAREHLPQSGGLIFIVEPPMREPTLDLMWLRDRVAKEGMIPIEGTDFNGAEHGDEDGPARKKNGDKYIDEELDDDDHEEIVGFGGEDDDDDDDDEDDDDSNEDHDEDHEDPNGPQAYDPTEDDEQDARELEVQANKDPFFSMPGASVLAPCPDGTMRCPMAMSKAGWCYAQPPRMDFRAMGLCPWDREIEDAMRITWTQPGFSYLILQAFGDQKPQEEIYGFKAGPESIALSDQERTPALVCRDKRVKKDNRVPYRGAYLPPRKPIIAPKR